MKTSTYLRSSIVAAALLACQITTAAQNTSGNTAGDAAQESPARADVEKLIADSGATVALAFQSLDGKQSLFLQADKQFPAAGTTIKIPIMIEIYAEAQSGDLRLADMLPIHDDFKSIVDGSQYRLDPKSDPDSELYKAIGENMSLRDLCNRMVTRNSNLAADLLIERLGAEKIRERLAALHIDGIDFRRGFESRPNTTGPNNSTSARGLMELLWTLAKGNAVSGDVSQEMIGILARSDATTSAPADANAEVIETGGDSQTTHMAADVTGVHHEETIVYGARSFVLVIMTTATTTAEASAALMARISHSLAAALQ